MSTVQQIPIDYSLINSKNNASALFTFGQPSSGQSLDVAIWNRTAAVLQVPRDSSQGTATPSADRFHFAFHFPPGLLARPGLSITVPDGWSASDSSTDDDGFTRIYILRTGVSLDLPVHEEGAPLKFQLQGIYLDNELAWDHTSVVLQSQGLINNGSVVPTSFRRIPLRILHTFATDLSDLDSAQSLPELQVAMVELRDIVVPPLQVRILEDWNFLTDVNLQTVRLEISTNPHFFSAHNEATLNVSSADSAISIAALTQTAGEDISAELNVGADDWDLDNAGDSIVLKPHSTDTVIDDTHVIELTLTIRVMPLNISYLEVVCNGFKNRNIAIETFTLTIPFYVGALRVRDASAGAPITAFGPASNEGATSIFTVGELEGEVENAAGIKYGLRVADGGGYSGAWIQSFGQTLDLSAGEDPVVAMRESGGNVGIGLYPSDDRWRLHVAGVNNADDVKEAARFRGDVELKFRNVNARGNLHANRDLPQGMDRKILAGKAMMGIPYGGEYQFFGSNTEPLTDPFLRVTSGHWGDGRPTILESAGGLHLSLTDSTPFVFNNGQVKIGSNTTNPSDSVLGLSVDIAAGETATALRLARASSGPQLDLGLGVAGSNNELGLEAGTTYNWLNANRPLMINHDHSQQVFLQASNEAPVVIGRGGISSMEELLGNNPADVPAELSIRLFVAGEGVSPSIATTGVTISNGVISVEDEHSENKVLIENRSILMTTGWESGRLTEEGLSVLTKLMSSNGLEVKFTNQEETFREGENDIALGGGGEEGLVFVDEVSWMHERWSEHNTMTLIMEPLPPEED